VLNPFQLHSNNKAEIETAQYWANAFRAAAPSEESSFEPVSDILYPIIDNLSSIEISPEMANSSTVVGTMATTIFWRDTIKNILPIGSDGLDIVFDFECASSFTYRIE
jgi:hypothetical protein